VAWLVSRDFSTWHARVPLGGAPSPPRPVASSGTPLAFVTTAEGSRALFFRLEDKETSRTSLWLETAGDPRLLETVEYPRYDASTALVAGRTAVVTPNLDMVRLMWLDGRGDIVAPSKPLANAITVGSPTVAGRGNRLWVAWARGKVPNIEIAVAPARCR
jgi:hypothetical protein